MAHLEAEISSNEDDFEKKFIEGDGAIFGLGDDEETPSPKKVSKQSNNMSGGQVEYEQGVTMYINGKPIRINKVDTALNKREKSNWLVHILFIRQEYQGCLNYVD